MQLQGVQLIEYIVHGTSEPEEEWWTGRSYNTATSGCE